MTMEEKKRLFLGEAEEPKRTRSTFVIRVLISLLLFVFCFLMDYRDAHIGKVDSQYIIHHVQKDLLGEDFPFLVEKLQLF